jgi:WD40 repeat protein
LGWGDETGRVYIARLDVIWHHCDGNLSCHSIATSHGVKISTFQVHHSDAVTKLEYWTDIGMFVTSGKDGTLRFTEPDRVLGVLGRARDSSAARWTLKAFKKQHLHGIFGFARSEKHNVIATWGLEREAFVWNPYSQQPMAELDGHGSSVMSVMFNDAADQVITASAMDKCVRIWCATTFTLTKVRILGDGLCACAGCRGRDCIVIVLTELLQNIIESHQFIPSNCIVSAFVLKYSQRLIIGGPSRILSRDIVVPKPFTFESAVCCAVNTDRSQIITVDKDSLIQVWDSRDGGGMCVGQRDARADCCTAAAITPAGMLSPRKMEDDLSVWRRCCWTGFTGGCVC